MRTYCDSVILIYYFAGAPRPTIAEWFAASISGVPGSASLSPDPTHCNRLRTNERVSN